MRSEVTIRFDPQRVVTIPLDGVAPWAPEQARRWLDEEFVKHDCVPLRASGKVLVADKVLSLAATLGAAAFDDPAWARDYACAASAALGQPLVSVDVPALNVTF